MSWHLSTLLTLKLERFTDYSIGLSPLLWRNDQRDTSCQKRAHPKTMKVHFHGNITSKQTPSRFFKKTHWSSTTLRMWCFNPEHHPFPSSHLFLPFFLSHQRKKRFRAQRPALPLRLNFSLTKTRFNFILTVVRRGFICSPLSSSICSNCEVLPSLAGDWFEYGVSKCPLNPCEWYFYIYRGFTNPASFWLTFDFIRLLFGDRRFPTNHIVRTPLIMNIKSREEESIGHWFGLYSPQGNAQWGWGTQFLKELLGYLVMRVKSVVVNRYKPETRKNINMFSATNVYKKHVLTL